MIYHLRNISRNIFISNQSRYTQRIVGYAVSTNNTATFPPVTRIMAGRVSDTKTNLQLLQDCCGQSGCRKAHGLQPRNVRSFPFLIFKILRHRAVEGKTICRRTQGMQADTHEISLMIQSKVSRTVAEGSAIPFLCHTTVQ